MANNEQVPRQYNTGLVNIVGVNQVSGVSSPVATGLQMPNNPVPQPEAPRVPEYQQLPDITDQKFDQMRQESEQRYQIVKQSMEFQAGVRQAALQAKGSPQRHLELAGIFDSIANAGLKYMEYEQQKQAKKDDYELKRNSMMARAALEEITIGAQGRIREYGLEHGINTTREDARRVLEYYSQVLPPEQMEPLYTFYGTELRELEAQSTTRYFEATQEQKEAQIALVKSQLTYGLSSILGSMSNPQQSQQQTDMLFNQANEYVLANTQGLDPTVRLQIMADVLTPFGSAATTTAGQRTAIEQRQADIQWFLPFVEQELRPQYGDDPTQFKYQLWLNAPESIRPLLNDIPNNNQIMSDIAGRYDSENSIRGHHRAQERERIAAQGLQPQDVKVGLELGYRIMQGDANAVAQLSLLQSKKPEELLPYETMALQYYETWQNDRQELERLHGELNSAEANLAGIVRSYPVSGAPETVNWIDQATGRAYQLMVQDANGNPVPADNPTPEQIEAAKAQVDIANAERQRLQNELQRLLERSSRSGFDVLNPNNHQYLDLIYGDLDEQAASQTFGSSQVPNDPSGNPNFGFSQQPNSPPGYQAGSPTGWQQNRPADLSGFRWSADEPPPGYPSGQSPTAPLARDNGHVIPFTHTRQGEIVVSSERGDRVSPTGGGVRFHAGVDFASESMYTEDVGAVTPAGGQVLEAWDWDDYGGTVLIMTPEGYIEQYSHLRNFFVKPGDSLRPGEPVGVVGGGQGDPMPGGSTGRHLHMNVWKPGTTEYTNPRDNTIDPLVYLEQLQEFEQPPQGTGSPPGRPVGATSYMPTPDALADGRGNWYGNLDAQRYPYLTAFINQGGGRDVIQSIPVEQIYQPSNPTAQTRMSGNGASYPHDNNPNHNYGYDIIAHDADFARALAEVSTELGIPAVWLADLMAYESAHSFDPGKQGPETYLGRGIGLIQAMSGGVLADWGYSIDEVSNMTRGEYTRLIARRYLLPFKGRINSIYDLASSIFTGDVGASPTSSDGYHSMQEYVNSLGNSVGRSYRDGGLIDLSDRLGRSHEQYSQGCPVCDQQITRYGAIIPHEART